MSAATQSNRDLHSEIRGRELENIRALSIPWPPGKRATHIHCPLPSHNDRNPSWRWDARKSRYHCTCGGGNVIDLAMAILGLDFAGAAFWIRGEVFGEVSNVPHPALRRISDAEREAQRIERERDDAEREREDAEHLAGRAETARKLWAKSVPASPAADNPARGSAVRRYLRSRGITIRPPGTIRFIPATPEYPHPSMLCAFGLPNEPEPGRLEMPLTDVRGVHLTKLRRDGSGKADLPRDEVRRAIAGHGFPIVLAPINDSLGLAIGEGVESMLSVAQATGLGAWAAGAANWLPALADKVHPCVETVTIYAERDGGFQYAERLAELLDKRGFEVLMAEAPQ